MKHKVTKPVTEVLQSVESATQKIEHEMESALKPVRKNVFSRFPILFTLLVTFGVSTTFLGFERIVSDIAFINDRPVLMLSIGIGVLAVTGTLYKKLG